MKALKAITYSKSEFGDSLKGDRELKKLNDKCLKMADIQQSNRNVFITLKASP